MEKSHRITVTQNVTYCLDTLGKALKDLPEGDKKIKARQALDYLMNTARGDSQPLRGRNCQPPIKIYPG